MTGKFMDKDPDDHTSFMTDCATASAMRGTVTSCGLPHPKPTWVADLTRAPAISGALNLFQRRGVAQKTANEMFLPTEFGTFR